MQGKRMAKIVVVCCAAALMAFGGIACADTGQWGGGHGEHVRHNFRKMAKQLGLTDAQKAQAKAIFQANKPVVQPLFASLRTERKNLQALIHADAVDETAIRAETAKIAGIQADLNVNRANMNAQFRAILTTTQQATLKSLGQGPATVPPATPPAP